MYCQKCNSPVPDDSLFCPSCGAKLEKENQRKFCIHCGHELFADDAFCCNCGKPVDQIEPLSFERNNADSVKEEPKKKTGIIVAVIAIILVVVIAIACSGNNPDNNSISKSDELERIDAISTVSRGSISGSIYSNDYFGIRCDLTSNFAYATDEEIETILGVSLENISDENLREKLADGSRIYDMYAYSNDFQDTINVVLSYSEGVGSYSEKEMLEALSGEMEEVFSAEVYENTTVDVVTVNFMGEEHYALNISSQMNNTQIYEKQLYILNGDYMAVITFGSYNSPASVDSMIDMFG